MPLIATGSCDCVTIFSHFPHFTELCQDQVNILLSTLPLFSEVFEEYCYIAECIFEEVLNDSGNMIDYRPHRSGKASTQNGGQRYLILGATGLYGHQ